MSKTQNPFLDTGMTLTVWWSVIIKAGLHRRTGGVAFRRVTDGERQGGTGMGHHPERGVWSEEREGSAEDMRKCLGFNA